MKLPFCAVSKAYSVGEPASEGMRNYAKVAHRFKLPVTWIIHPEGAKPMAAELERWHEEFGDEVALGINHVPINAKAYMERRDALQKICPWSDVRISGCGGDKSGKMLAAIEEAGFQGHWGYCWEQTWVDGITDSGQPPGLFFASPASYKMPRPGGGGVVAVEWLSRDLNKAFWTGNPVNFCQEPDAQTLMGDWPEEKSLAYFEHLVDQYSRNARAGQAIPFIFQEETEQLMEKLGGMYANGAWQRALAWLEKALTSVAGHGEIEFTTLPDIVRRFREGEWALPRLYRAGDRAFPPLKDPRSNTRVYGAEMEFPEVLHYCSENLFATFRSEGTTPVRLIRYDLQQACGVDAALQGAPRIPSLYSLVKQEERWHAVVSAEESMPFALRLPLAPNEAPPSGCPRNEDAWVWEFRAEPGTREYHSP